MVLYAVATMLSMLFASAAAASRRSALAVGDIAGGQSRANGRIFFAICSALPLIVLAALRHEVGMDWPIYSDFFQGINQGSLSFNEIGFNLLNRLVYWIMPDFALMVAVCSVITYTFIFKAIYDQSVNYAFSILFFVLDATYFNAMNQLRQMMAVAIFLYAMKYISKRRLLPYAVWMLVAASIHTSALLLIPVYFIYNLRVNLKVQVIALAAGAVLMIPLNRLLAFIVSKTRYGWYLESVYTEFTGFYVVGFVFSLAVLALYVFYYYYGQDRDDRDYNLIVNMFFCSVLLLFFTESIPQASRLVTCFAAPIMLGIPRMLLRERVANRRFVLTVLVILLFAAKLLYDVYSNEWYGVIPYQTIFSR